MSKTLSIITPLYNSATWLEKCLLSILDQDIPKEQMEIICVNDGSPDNSADMARIIGERLEVGGEYNPIIVLNQENQGPSGARNTGMKVATGKYLMFVDPDDYVEPNTFGGLVKRMDDEQLDMLRFNYQIVDENYNSVEKRDYEKAFDYTPCRMTGIEFLADRLDIDCNIWRYIYRTEIITKNNIWCYTGDYYDDTPWLPLVLMKANSINLSNSIIYDYMERSNSLVKGSSPKMIQRKIDGSFMLLQLLEDQLKNMSNYLPLMVNSNTVLKIMMWYKMIEAYMFVNICTYVAIYQFQKRKAYVRRLNDLKVYPNMEKSFDSKIKRKFNLIKISPLLMIWFVKLKNL